MPDDMGAVGNILELRGVTWEWRDEAPEEAKAFPGLGVIAQDVERVFPQLVETGEDGIKRVAYYGLIGPLIEAVKELDARVRTLEGQVGDREGTGPASTP
jgi:hypothetical protein